MDLTHELIQNNSSFGFVGLNTYNLIIKRWTIPLTGLIPPHVCAYIKPGL
jgi:hypothetical protein